MACSVFLCGVQVAVPLLLVNSSDDPLVHRSLLAVPRTLAGVLNTCCKLHPASSKGLKKSPSVCVNYQRVWVEKLDSAARFSRKHCKAAEEKR